MIFSQTPLFFLDDQVGALSPHILFLVAAFSSSPPAFWGRPHPPTQPLLYLSGNALTQHCGAYFILRDHKLNSRNTLYRHLFSAMQIIVAGGKINIFN